MKPQIKEQYEKHVKAKRLEKWKIRGTQLFILISFFVLWEVASRMQWIDPLLFSSPSNVFELFVSMLTSGTLHVHIGVTLLETILGFIIGTIGGIVIAASLWWSPFLSRVLDPYLVILNAMPKVALGPFSSSALDRI